MTDIPKAAIDAAHKTLFDGPSEFKDAFAAIEAAIRAALPHIPGYQEPIIKAVERILDECSAWVARPNPDVTMRIALAAGLAVMTSQSERHDRIYDDGFAAGQEAMRAECDRVALAYKSKITGNRQWHEAQEWAATRISDSIRALPIDPPAEGGR